MNYKTSKVFKSLCLILATSIFFLDIAWAIDVRQKLVEDQIAIAALSEGRLSGNPNLPESNTRFERIAQSTVDNQNDILELQQNIFSLTTDNGDLIEYVGDTINRITRADGTTLTNLSFDVNTGEVVGADLELFDGSVQIFSGGEQLAYRTPDGTILHYKEGKVERSVAIDNTETLYSYTYAEDGALLTTTLENDKLRTIYDANNRIISRYSFTNKSTAFYVDNVLSQIQDANGNILVFNATEANGLLDINLSHYQSADNTLYAYGSNTIATERIFSSNGSEITEPLFTYYENGRLKTQFIPATGATLEYSDQDFNDTGQGRLVNKGVKS
jgi:antitoxin component YwqK of YwqJK toxin-antitoxin module